MKSALCDAPGRLPELAERLTRRRWLQLGAAGLSLPLFSQLRRAQASERGDPRANRPNGRAKACIVFFAWGGMSHLDTWDLKPEAGDDIRGEFHPLATKIPGIQISEHLPQLAARAAELAIVRSVCHLASGHREAAYWNLTGHQPKQITAPAIPPSMEDWPVLGSMVAKYLSAQPDGPQRVLPAAVTMPHPCADRGLLNGQYAGFLGNRFAPTFVHPNAGRPYEGISPPTSQIELGMPPGVDAARLSARRDLLQHLERQSEFSDRGPFLATEQAREQAVNLLLSPQVQGAFELAKEPAALRQKYGDHVCGQSALLARRLVESGVPLITINCGAGDLNGGAGSHWDTHGDNFNRLKRDLLPPLDMASGALLDDLRERGMLDQTLVVWLTEFGRTPRITGNGRNHFPNCYSVAFAGGGIHGGQVHGRSDKIGSEPAEAACGPADLHATIFHALGIDPQFTIADLQGRPHPLCEGQPLPIL
ncbi:MAG TPA: DUF1501 domain-containing protein [Pirellulales bacterium]|jgi:hypothetical protein|nr:DUF1501 domain-containing protein [Pirellulales bacterium]